MTKNEDFLIPAIGLLSLLLVTARYPRQTGAFLEALSAPAQKSAEESDKAYRDLLSRWSLIETERVISQARDKKSNEEKCCISIDHASCDLRLSSYRRWVATFDVDGAPECITVGAETKQLAIEYAEGALWLQLGKPDLDGFAPLCTSCVELSS